MTPKEIPMEQTLEDQQTKTQVKAQQSAGQEGYKAGREDFRTGSRRDNHYPPNLKTERKEI